MTARFSNLEKYREAKREVEQRRRVYARLLDEQKMSTQDADRKISIMEEIADEYKELADMERLI
jgi:hypothetical protein